MGEQERDGPLRCPNCGREPRQDENADDEWRAGTDGVWVFGPIPLVGYAPATTITTTESDPVLPSGSEATTLIR